MKASRELIAVARAASQESEGKKYSRAPLRHEASVRAFNQV